MSEASTMLAFAGVADAIAATASKREKVRLLGEYLSELDASTLPVATRFFAGRVFPLGDPRTLGAGGALFRTVLLHVASVDEAVLTTVWARHADVGDTARELFAHAGRAGGVELLDVWSALEQLSAASRSRGRSAVLISLLERCSAAEACYITKLLAGEMRIGLREGLVGEAIARAFERAPARVARADMLVGDLGAVAVLAQSNRLDEATPRIFAPLRYMLASPAADSADVIARLGERVWVEDKYDGIRCGLHSDGAQVQLYSRDLKNVTVQFPEVAAKPPLPARNLMLDGELLAMREGDVLSFASLQTRLGRMKPDAALLEEAPVVYVAWDLLDLDGESLLELPLRVRRARLEELQLKPPFLLAHMEQAEGAVQLDGLFTDARARGNEGLLVKDPESPYLPGRRGLHWLKLKRPLDTLDVVVVGAEYGNGRRRAVLSDVTFAVRVDATGELAVIGKAFTGLTDAEIAEMTLALIGDTVREMGRYRAVLPRIVLEIAFDSVQRSSRHPSGLALRFPRIVRWRRDKGVEDIDTVARVEALVGAREAPGRTRVDAPSGG